MAKSTVFVALLRAVNVGGTGKISMKDLSGLCTTAGFARVQTYIQSGNVVFASGHPADRVRTTLERALNGHMGKRVDVLVRDAADLRRVLDANPFPKEEPARVAVVFCAAPVPNDLAKTIVAPGGERVIVGRQELYIHYPDGMGRSKLKLPKTLGPVTVRNINTVARLVSMAEA